MYDYIQNNYNDTVHNYVYEMAYYTDSYRHHAVCSYKSLVSSGSWSVVSLTPTSSGGGCSL